MSRRLEFFEEESGRCPCEEWLEAQDRSNRVRFAKRFARIRETGNLGDHKPVGQDVWELRFSFGAGYRVYFTLDGETLVLLLCGGDKSTQPRDIERARELCRQWRNSR
jgi:putative addiction module killer protein